MLFQILSFPLNLVCKSRELFQVMKPRFYGLSTFPYFRRLIVLLIMTRLFLFYFILFFFWTCLARQEIKLWSYLKPLLPLLKVTVSNNSTKWRQNGFKIGTRDKFATHFGGRKTLFQIRQLFTQFFFAIGDFPILFSIYTSYRIHHVFRAWGACALTWVQI